MGPLDLLFGQVKDAITNHSSPNTPGPSYDPSGLLGQLSGLFGQHAPQIGHDFEDQSGGQYGGQYGGQNVAPSSQDPWGDPADQSGQYVNQGQFGNVAPASQDPFGDPADQAGGGQFGNVAPASQDPWGDPADQR